MEVSSAGSSDLVIDVVPLIRQLCRISMRKGAVLRMPVELTHCWLVLVGLSLQKSTGEDFRLKGDKRSHKKNILSPSISKNRIIKSGTGALK